MLKKEVVAFLQNKTDGELFLRKRENLRIRSEFEEFKKQQARRKKKLKTEIEISLFRKVLPIMDNFKFMLEKGAAEDHQNNLDGLILIYKELSQFIEKEENEIGQLQKKHKELQGIIPPSATIPDINNTPKIEPMPSRQTTSENIEMRSDSTTQRKKTASIQSKHLPQHRNTFKNRPFAPLPDSPPRSTVDIFHITLNRVLLFMFLGLLIGYISFILIH